MVYFKPPKDDVQVTWTRHVVDKMRQYGFSQARLRRLLNYPERQELGIAPGTIALMQTTGTKKRLTEIWLMYQQVDQKKRIITAWRYPGVSPKREVPFPEDEDLLDLKNQLK